MIEYELIRSKRKTISVSVDKDANVIVRAPLRLPKRDVERFVVKHLDWIEKRIQSANSRRAEAITLTDSQICELTQRAKLILPERAAYYGGIMGVMPDTIKITSAKRSWGTCIHRENKVNICFSYRVMLLPDELVDYIVVHELAHIRVRNHSKDFYNVVAEYVPDYIVKRQKLRQFAAKYN